MKMEMVRKYQGWGKIKKEEEKMITLFEREIIVWVKEFDSGLQRVGAFFADRNKSFLTKQNIELRKKVQELEDKIKNNIK